MSETPTTTERNELVYCVDDDDMTLLLYEKTLVPRGYRVEKFAHALELLEALDATRPDLIVLDIDMPYMTGLEALERIRNRPGGGSIPVIIVSAMDSESGISAALEKGADDYLVKPIKRPELMAKATAAMKRRLHNVRDPSDLREGSVFNDRFEIFSQIGTGGYSTVYKAKDLQDESSAIALKLIRVPQDKMDDSSFLSICLREAYEHSRLHHPNIVELRDFGQVGRTYYLALEYLDGLNLYDYLQTYNQLSERRGLLIAQDITMALLYMDARGMMHRDIKPLNIMLLKTGMAKLLDFGLARHQLDDTLSNTQEFSGTPSVVSPEYAFGHEPMGIHSDIYSLGATLFYGYTGRFPISGESALDILQNQLNQAPLELHNMRSDISPETSELINRMLAKQPGQRPAINDLIRELETLISSTD